MALLEAKGAENVIEACGRVRSVKRCILSSSLLASVWQRNVVSGVLDESCWTDEEFCRENKVKIIACVLISIKHYVRSNVSYVKSYPMGGLAAFP